MLRGFFFSVKRREYLPPPQKKKRKTQSLISALFYIVDAGRINTHGSSSEKFEQKY